MTVFSSNISSSAVPVTEANSTVTVEYNNATSSFCFLQAQNWPGVDTVDCSNSSASCVDANAGSRIANLYNDTIVRLSGLPLSVLAVLTSFPAL